MNCCFSQVGRQFQLPETDAVSNGVEVEEFCWLILLQTPKGDLISGLCGAIHRMFVSLQNSYVPTPLTPKVMVLGGEVLWAEPSGMGLLSPYREIPELFHPSPHEDIEADHHQTLSLDLILDLEPLEL